MIRLVLIRLFVLAFVANIVNVKAQNETTKWCFGKGAGLDFSMEPPTSLTNSVTNPSSCGTSIADASGNLLFYTNGQTIWNNQHVVMANGSGLFSGGSAEQSGLIVKQPGNTNVYYIFCNGGGTVGLLYYSVVDLSLALGQGSVTVKNATLSASSCEKLSATKHSNGTDVWILIHEYGNNNFKTFLLSNSGISTSPVISSVGSSYSGNYNFSQGYHKLSPHGTKLIAGVSSTSITSTFELYDFDHATGVVSNQLVLGSFYGINGCEFSADGSKVYGALNNSSNSFLQSHLVQWDLCAGSSAAIIASMDTIGVCTSTNVAFTALQLARNGKIYVGRGINQNLAVINSPSQLGIGCNFVDLGQALLTGTATSGLPNFETSLLKASYGYTSETNCTKVTFSVPYYLGCSNLGYTVSSYSWIFGDPASSVTNVSNLSNPTHQFSAAGTYTVKLAVNYTNCAPDTFKKVITVTAIPSLILNGKQNICKNENTILSVSGANTYSWSTGATTPTVILSPTISTTYTVSGTFTNNTCETIKTVTVNVLACTDIAEDKNSESISIYPNPFTNNVYIETQNKNFIALTYSIVNSMGEKVKTGIMNEAKVELNLEFLNAGFYVLYVQSQEERGFKKIIIKQ